MLIQLKQNEIESALRMYTSSQGISLQGRTVDISFTSGRGGNGVTADLDIQESSAGSVGPQTNELEQYVSGQTEAVVEAKPKAVVAPVLVPVAEAAEDDSLDDEPVPERKTSLFG